MDNRGLFRDICLRNAHVTRGLANMSKLGLQQRPDDGGFIWTLLQESNVMRTV